MRRRGARRPAARSRSRSATARGASRSPAARTASRLADSGPPMRLPRPARVPGRRLTRSRQHYAAAWAVRAGRHVRQASRARGVRGQLRLRRRTRTPPATTARSCTTPCWPARPGWIAWNNTDFDPGRPGPVPAPRVRAALRPDRRDRAAQAASSREMKAFAATLRAVDIDPLRSGRRPTPPSSCPPIWTPPTRSPARRTAPTSHQTLRQAYVSARLADLPVALTRESGGIGQRRPPVPGAIGQATARAHTGATSSASRRRAPPSTSPTRRAPPHGTRARPTARLNDMFGVEHQLRPRRW